MPRIESPASTKHLWVLSNLDIAVSSPPGRHWKTSLLISILFRILLICLVLSEDSTVAGNVSEPRDVASVTLKVCKETKLLAAGSHGFRWPPSRMDRYTDKSIMIDRYCDFVNYVGDASPFHQKSLQQLLCSRYLADSLFRLFQDMWAGQHRRVKSDNLMVNKKDYNYSLEINQSNVSSQSWEYYCHYLY